MNRQLLIFIATVILLIMFPASATAENALKNHPSPYLALHGDDPVDWRDWGPAALQEAKSTNRMLFISSGYFSCHWCHVMQDESYADEEVAKFLNKYFIPVKIDRELESALDTYLISFVERTRGTAGWPLNVFLTPEGYPLTGFTYAPRENVLQVLEKLSKRWDEESDKLTALAENAFALMQAGTAPSQVTEIERDILARAYVSQALNLANNLEGGFGDQNKFPMVPQQMALLELYRDNPNDDVKEFIELTLDQIAEKGMRDHLAGGFFRYTVDPSWEIPHYEKMLYTQAQLIRLYLTASEILPRPDYLDVAIDTAEFVLKRMKGNSGGYISSFSAIDESDAEGGSYLWDGEQLTKLLNQQERAFAALRWGLSMEKGGEQLPITRMSLEDVAVNLGIATEEAGQLQEQVIHRLLTERDYNPPPADSKQLAGWNGLLLTALSELAQKTGSPYYQSAARRLGDWLLKLWDGDKLARSNFGPRVIGSASLADYAYVAEGLLSLSRLTNINDYAQASNTIADTAWKRFFGKKGWKLSDSMLIPGLDGEAALQGSPMPAPSAVLMALSEKHEKLASAQQLQVGTIADEPFWYPGHMLQALQNTGGQKDE